MVWKKIDKIEFDYDSTLPESPYPIHIDNSDLKLLMNAFLPYSKINTDYFNFKSEQIKFSLVIEKSCELIFDAIKFIIEKEKDYELGARLASRLFEYFTTYWHHTLLKDGLVLHGISLWKKVLQITKEWEDNNKPIKIHKGSPYFFLAYNYLMVGDRDSAFTYLYNAIEDDKILGKLQPAFNYPKEAPAFKTATFSGDKNNMLYPLMEDLRKELSLYISQCNSKMGINFTISVFDKKFCENNDLLIRVYFFTSNFLFLYQLNHAIDKELLQNDFSVLRISDLIFNFSLIIDEILKYICDKNSVNISYLSESVEWICNKYNWINQSDLQNLKNQIQFKTQEPSKMIPILLGMNLNLNGNSIKKEVYPFLLTNYLRNHTAHNLSQQKVFTSRYDEIIEMLMICLFLSIDSLP